MAQVFDVIKVAVLAINVFSMIRCLPQRTGSRAPGILLALAVFAAVMLKAPFAGIGLPIGLFFLPPMILLTGGRLSEKLFCFFAIFWFSLSIALFVSFLSESIHSYQSPAYYGLVAILSFFTFGAYLLWVVRCGRRFGERLFHPKSGSWFPYAAVAFLCWLTVVKLYFNDGANPLPLPLQRNPFYILLPFLVIACFILVCVAIVKTHERLEIDHEVELSRSILKSGKEHLERLAALSDEIRIMRHDYKHHLAALSSMLGDAGEASAYLAEVERNFDDASEPFFCDRAAVNALLAHYRKKCVDEGISFEAALRLPPREGSAVEDHELCIVLGNLLENAFEACLRLGRECARVVVIEANHQGRQLVVRTTNSFDGALASAKQGGGLGMKSIEAVVVCHGGRYVCDANENCFFAYVIMDDKTA